MLHRLTFGGLAVMQILMFFFKLCILFCILIGPSPEQKACFYCWQIFGFILQ